MNYRSASLILSVTSLAGFIFIFLQFYTRPKVAYVDSSRLLSNYKGMIQARNDFEKKSIVWQSNLDTLKTELNKALRKHEQQVSSLSINERKLAEQLLRNKQDEYIRYEQAILEKSQAEDAQMTERGLEEVNVFFKQYGEEHNYKIIFGANSTGNIIYANEAVDITDLAIDQLNSKYQGI